MIRRVGRRPHSGCYALKKLNGAFGWLPEEPSALDKASLPPSPNRPVSMCIRQRTNVQSTKFRPSSHTSCSVPGTLGLTGRRQ